MVDLTIVLSSAVNVSHSVQLSSTSQVVSPVAAEMVGLQSKAILRQSSSTVAILPYTILNFWIGHQENMITRYYLGQQEHRKDVDAKQTSLPDRGIC